MIPVGIRGGVRLHMGDTRQSLPHSNECLMLVDCARQRSEGPMTRALEFFNHLID
jgi:hypothetical protein